MRGGRDLFDELVTLLARLAVRDALDGSGFATASKPAGGRPRSPRSARSKGSDANVKAIASAEPSNVQCATASVAMHGRRRHDER